MSNSIFPEKRTRSQIALPDDILKVPEVSPLKDARNALRNHLAATNLHHASPSIVDDSEDELLLSPRKSNNPSKHLNTHGLSKRSVSPPPGGDYPKQGLPLEGRELKRLKQDIDTNRQHAVTSRHAASIHTRTNSEREGSTLRRSERKRTGRIANSLFATSSLSPPPTQSPPESSTRKGRAQSVPLLPSSYPMPRIDLANPPTSPRRARSRSRSPTKDWESKLRIRPVAMKQVDVLSSIPDEVGATMDVDEQLPAPQMNHVEAPTSRLEESTNRISSEGDSVIQEPSETQPGPDKLTNEEIMRTDSPGIPNNAESVSTGKEGLGEGDTSKISDLPPAVPTKSILEQGTGVEHNPIDNRTSGNMLTRENIDNTTIQLPQPTLDSNASQHHPAVNNLKNANRNSSIAVCPSTPEAALNDIFFTSPLTPLPETADSSIADDRYASSSGWGMAPEPQDDTVEMFPEIKPTHGLQSSENQSRLPRSSLVPATLPEDSKGKKACKIDPPIVPAAKPKTIAPTKSSISITGNKHVASGATNAFSLMMKKSSTDPKAGSKISGKQIASGQKASRVIPPSGKPGSTSLFPLTGPGKAQPRTKVEIPSGKIKAKMRPKEKHPKPKIVPVPVPPVESRRSIHESTQPDVVKASSGIKTDGKPTDSPAGATSNEGDASMQDLTSVRPGTGISDVTEQGEKSMPFESRTIPSAQEPDKLQASSENGSKASTATLNTAIIGTESAPPATVQLSVPDNKIQIPVATDSGANSRVLPTNTKSKLPHAKRRVPTVVPVASRVTRSVSSRQKQCTSEESLPKAADSNIQTAHVAVEEHRSLRGENVDTVSTEPALLISTVAESSANTKQEASLPPASPMRIVSPDRATPKSRTISHQKPVSASSPSPFKLVRSTSLFSVRERRQSIDLGHGQEGIRGSSLSTLSNALEKLRMPAPTRPNTSMGFNRELDSSDVDNDERCDEVSQQAHETELASHKLKPASSLGALGTKPFTHTKATGGSKPPVQRPLSSFLAGKTGPSTSKNLQSGTGAVMRAGSSVTTSTKPRIFGVGSSGIMGTGLRRSAPKASRIPTLPSVMGSPVKGGNSSDANTLLAEESTALPQGYGSRELITTGSLQNAEQDSTDVDHTPNDHRKGKAQVADTRKRDASRRASMASHLLNQSLNSLPPANPGGQPSMGPPATPSRGGSRSSSTSPRGNAVPNRSSTRLANTAQTTIGKVKGNEDEMASSAKAVPETLKILKDCVIYVDVRTDDGEEAGSLFAEMLEGVGAKILARVGQTCTHIVYKNGLMSTLNRYRLLRDPKPIVVGIRWVVDCVEQRKRVDESPYLIDLDGVNVAGTNKRRRSMLPKMLSREFTDAGSSDAERDQSGDVDTSMDESNSSISIDDHLPPLERARRRKSILVGPRS